MIEAPGFEIYAVKYATREAQSAEHFYGHDPHGTPARIGSLLFIFDGSENHQIGFSLIIDTFATHLFAQALRLIEG
jgi:hypothetical protein